MVRDARTRRVIRRIDVLSVLKVSLIFYVCVFIMLMVAAVILWNVAVDFGVITSIDKSVRSLFALSSFQLHPMTALAWVSAVVGALCFLGLLFNVFATILFNLISDVVGGVQVRVIEDQPAQPLV